MKKIIKPFDLEAAKNGAKLETRNGNKVKIFEWDMVNATYPIMGAIIYSDNEEEEETWTSDGKWGWRIDGCYGYDLVIVEYENEEEDEVISKEVELDLTYCDNGLFYEVHYKNDDSNSDKSIICLRDEQVNKLGEFLLSLIRDRMDSVNTNKVKVEMKLTPIKNESKTEKKGMEVD